jgi:hypothetical protein
LVFGRGAGDASPSRAGATWAEPASDGGTSDTIDGI